MPDNALKNLAWWLDRLERMQPDRIELGLERVSSVAESCELGNPDFKIITVAGTNGKGSTVAYAAHILRDSGYRVGIYTSPHFVDFNERIVVDNRRADEQMLCDAFALIDAVRGDTELTYFEFTTLAAMTIFKQAAVDVAVLEVGLGGRLDAVNAWDCDVACITSIGIDHQEWLGDDRETIGREKAGVARAHKPLICGDVEMPQSIAETARETQAQLLKIGSDFDWQWQGSGWRYSGPHGSLELPPPQITGDWAVGNASVAITACAELMQKLPVDTVVERALKQVTVPGRMQHARYRNASVLLDVAHNPQAAQALASYLQRQPAHTIAVFSCLADKDAAGVVGELAGCIDRWHIAQLSYPRAIASGTLADMVTEKSSAGVEVFASVIQAFDAAVAQSSAESRIVVFGSFHVVGPVLTAISG